MHTFPTEYFQVIPVGGDKVMIGGLHSPKGKQLLLTVHEDPEGVPDRYPRFREEEGSSNIKVRIVCHTVIWFLYFILTGLSLA